jgi:hypothetical protein
LMNMISRSLAGKGCDRRQLKISAGCHGDR